MKKGLVVFIISLGLVPLMITACGGSKKAASTEAVKFNETGFPIVDEPFTLRVIAQKHTQTKEYNELPVFKELEEKTNIHIEWEFAIDGDDWATKKPLVLASGELPDMFFAIGTLNESDVIGNSELFLPLDPLIEKYGNNIKAMFQDDPKMRGFSAAYDGHIYGLPQKMPQRPATLTVWAINQNWLDKVNLKMPSTTEEFYTVLKAFKERDPNGNGKADEIPWSFMGFQDLTGCMDIFGAFGVIESQNGMWLSVTNGKVQYIAAQDGFKDAIAYLNRLYSEGLIDPEVFTLDWSSFPARTNPPLTDPEIVGVAPHWSRAGAFAPERADHYPLLLPLKGPKGYQFWRQNPESVKGGKYALEITRSCKNPEIAFRWADAVYDEIIGLNLYYGSTIVEKHNDGTYTITPSPISGEEWASWTDALNDRSPAYISDRFNSFVPDFDSTTLYPQIADKEKLSPYFPKEYFPPVSFTPDDVSELSILRTDIHSYAQEQAATWVVNGGVEKEYDAFVRQLETMGLRRMEEIYQAAYDRYMGK